MNRRQFIKSAGAPLALLVFGWRPATMAPESQEAKLNKFPGLRPFWPMSEKGPNCRPSCVTLELQGRQNEPPVIYEVCD